MDWQGWAEKVERKLDTLQSMTEGNTKSIVKLEDAVVRAALSASELQVFNLLEEGSLTQRQIAEKLSVSEARVSQVVRKLKGLGLDFLGWLDDD